MKRRIAFLGFLLGLMVFGTLVRPDPSSCVPATDRRPRGILTEPPRLEARNASPALSSTRPGPEAEIQSRRPVRRPFVATAPGSGPVRFSVRDATVAAFFTDRGAAMTLVDPREKQAWGVHWTPVGITPVEPRPGGESLCATNFLLGDPSEWRTNVPGCSQLLYDKVLPGVIMVLESRPRGFEYRFHAAPGATIDALRFRYDGAVSLRVTENGSELDIETGIGRLREHGLRCSQPGDDGPRILPARYVQTGPTEVAIEIRDVDPRRELDVDPVIDWTFTIDPNSLVSPHGIARDAAGYLYITGATSSTDYPCIGGFDCTWDGQGDAFVTKLTPDGTSIVWSTYLGSTGNEAGQAIDVDASGNVYVAGTTTSTNFPGRLLGFQTTLNGTDPDAFLAKLDASGSSVLWSTYFGGSLIEDCWGLALDGATAVICGRTWSSDFPISGGFDSTFASQTEAFVAKINVGGNPTLAWSTYLGGSGNEEALALDLDSFGDIYVTGDTSSANFPVPGGFDTTIGSTSDIFVTKILANGSAIVWSTFLGGSTLNFELGEGIAVDGSGNVFVTGRTNCPDFPTTGGFQTIYGGSEDAFIAKISATGATLLWSTYLGGTNEEEAHAIALDTSGNAYVAGFTRSADFPIANAVDPTLNGPYDVFVTRVQSNGALAWSTYLGGPLGDDLWAMTATAPDSVYVAVRADNIGAIQIVHLHTPPSPPASDAGYCGLLGLEALVAFALLRTLRAVGSGTPKT
jgi:hypothetical protein